MVTPSRYAPARSGFRLSRPGRSAASPLSEPGQPFRRVDEYHQQKLSGHEDVCRDTRVRARKKSNPDRNRDIYSKRKGAGYQIPGELTQSTFPSGIRCHGGSSDDLI